MSYLIVLLVVAVEAVNLVLLWIGIRVTMSQWIPRLAACAGVSGAWGAWILVLALRGPLTMMVLTGAVFAASAVALGYAIHLATVEKEDRQEGGGAAEPAVNPAGPDAGGSDEPPWWPEFQGQLAAYAAQRDSDRQPVDC